MKVIIKNSNLVFQRKHQKTIVYKNYWVRQSGQYIALSRFADVVGLSFNNIKVEADIYIVGTSFSGSSHCFSARSNNCSMRTSSTNLFYWQNGGQSGSRYSKVVPSSGDYHIVANNKTGEITFGEFSGTFDPATSTSALNYAFIYATGDTDSAAVPSPQSDIKIARLKVYNATTNDLLIDIRPALVDGVPCLYEAVNDVELYSEDETTLVVE